MATSITKKTRRLVRDNLPQSVVDKVSPSRRRIKKLLRDDDVILVGHPKSGNTWLAFMIGVLLEKRRDIGEVTLARVEDFIPAVHSADFEIGKHSETVSPRVFRNEGPIFPTLYPKTLYIVRDPRAAYVSYYHHALHDTGRGDWPLDDFIEEMVREGRIADLENWLTRWDRHAQQWLDLRNRQAVHIVRYEDLKDDAEAAFASVVDFLGWDVTEAERAEAVRRGGFDEMRKSEVKHGAEPYSGTKGEGGFFTRKGTVDSWREELSEQANQRIITAFGPVMQQLGYELK